MPRKPCHVIIHCANQELGKEWGGRATQRNSPALVLIVPEEGWGWHSGIETPLRGGLHWHVCLFGWRAREKWEIFVGVSPTQYWSYHAALVAELLWLLSRWYHWSPSEMCEIKDLRELQVLWLSYHPILMSGVFWPRKFACFFFFKSIIARTSSTRAGKWSLMFIRALRAAAGFWKTYSSASKGPWCSARLDVAWENLGAVHHTLILCLAQSTWGVLSTGKIFWVLPVCLVRCSGGLSHYPACGPVP